MAASMHRIDNGLSAGGSGHGTAASMHQIDNSFRVRCCRSVSHATFCMFLFARCLHAFAHSSGTLDVFTPRCLLALATTCRGTTFVARLGLDGPTGGAGATSRQAVDGSRGREPTSDDRSPPTARDNPRPDGVDPRDDRNLIGGAGSLQRRLRVVTDCSGLETPSIALKLLGVDARLVAASEINSKLRRCIEDSFAPGIIHLRMSVDASPAPGGTDLYIAGPPCQDFSLAGGRAGPSGARGGLFEVAVDRNHSPSAKCLHLGEHRRNFIH